MAGKSETQIGSLRGRIRVNGMACDASLRPDGKLMWQAEDDGERCLSLESEVLGFGIEDGRRIRLRVFVGDTKMVTCGVGGGAGKSSMKDYVLEMESDEMMSFWSERLTDRFNSLGRPKRLFFILNPFGGKKCARKIFQNEIKPLLEAAGVLYTLQETKYQLHAQEIAYKLDLLKYDGIVCVSGDGVLVENAAARCSWILSLVGWSRAEPEALFTVVDMNSISMLSCRILLAACNSDKLHFSISSREVINWGILTFRLYVLFLEG